MTDFGAAYALDKRLFRRKLSPSINGTQGENAHGRLQARDLPNLDGPRAGLVIDDKVFDAAKLTGKPAMRPCSRSSRTGGRSGRPEERAAGAGKSASRASRLAAPSSGADPRPSAIYCAGATYADPCRRDGAPHEPAAGARSAHAGSQRLAFHQGVADADRPRRDREGVRRLRKSRLGGGACRVIGRPPRTSRRTRRELVAANTAANDLSARDRGRVRTSAILAVQADWTKHKTFDGSCPLGP